MDQTVRNVRAFGNRVFIFRLVRGARGAKPALIKALVDWLVPFRRLVLRDLAPQVLNSGVVKPLRRSHKDVVPASIGTKPEVGEHTLQFTRNIVGLLLRSAGFPFGG